MKFFISCLFLFFGVALIKATNIHTGQCDGAKFRSGTEGQWGDPCMTDPTVATDFYGCLRDDYFDLCVGTDLVLGCKNTSQNDIGFTMTFTNAQAIDIYVPQLGPNNVLPLKQNWIDPPQFINPNDPIVENRKGVAGNFGANLVALAMNIDYDKCIADPTNSIPQATRDQYNDRCFPFSQIHVCDNQFFTNAKRTGTNCINGVNSGSYANGQPLCWNCASYYDYTIGQIFDIAQRALGGCCHVPPPPHLICDASWATHSLAIGVNYIVGDHPDGSERPPLYCFRIDDMELINSPQMMQGKNYPGWVWTFSCDTGNLHFRIDAPTAGAPTACGDLVWTGNFHGGKDGGNNWNAWSTGTWQMDYRIKQDDVSECVLGLHGYIKVNSKTVVGNKEDTAGGGLSPNSIGHMTLTSSSITYAQNPKFQGFATGFSFDIRNKAKEPLQAPSNMLYIHENHRQVAGMSIEGWHQFSPAGANNWNVFGGAKDWLSVICDPNDSPTKRSVDHITPVDCDVEKLNACMTMINQAFQSGQPLQAFHGRKDVFQLATCVAADP